MGGLYGTRGVYAPGAGAGQAGHGGGRGAGGLRHCEGRRGGRAGPQPAGDRPEPEAIAQACRTLGGWRLAGCALYVTLEPCPMCAGAIVNARIPAVYYGAKDDKAGCCGSVLNLFEERFNHHPRIYGRVLEAECAALLQEFFQSLR